MILAWLLALAPAVQDATVKAKADRVAAAFAVPALDQPDGSDFAQTPGYCELVEALLAMDPTEVQAMRPVALDDAQALSAPESLRGKFVSVRGYVARRKPIVLETPNGGTTTIERAIVKLDSGRRAVAVDLIGGPPPFKNQADIIELSGVFYRTVRYASQVGGEAHLPYVLARSLTLIDTPSSALARSLFSGGAELGVGILLGLLGVFGFVFYLRRSARDDS